MSGFPRLLLFGMTCALASSIIGLLALGLIVAPSQAQSGSMHNCPPAGEWSIAVWEGSNNTAATDALATCGADAVDAAYSLDSQTGSWSRWFAGKPDVSNLTKVDDMMGVLALAAPTPPEAETPTAVPPTPTPTATVHPTQNPTATPTATSTPTHTASPTPTSTSTPHPTPTPSPSPTPTPIPVDLFFSGHPGTTDVGPFQLCRGLVQFTLTHNGQGAFVVEFHSTTCPYCEEGTLVDVVGSYSDSIAFEVCGNCAWQQPCQNYALHIVAVGEGDWSVRVQQ
jgi:hypothetical protein